MHFFKAASTHPPVQTPIFQALPQKSKFGSLFLIGLVLRFPKRFFHRQKLGDEKDFLETGCFQPRAVPWRLADLSPPPKTYLY
jgi:hypothetical protein